jgi:hypothetical protein
MLRHFENRLTMGSQTTTHAGVNSSSSSNNNNNSQKIACFKS